MTRPARPARPLRSARCRERDDLARRQPGIRRWRERRRVVHERLRGALQLRDDTHQRRGVVGPVRHRGGHELVRHSFVRNGAARQVLPRAARGRNGRERASGTGCDRHDEPERREREDRARPRHGRPDVRCNGRELLGPSLRLVEISKLVRSSALSTLLIWTIMRLCEARNSPW